MRRWGGTVRNEGVLLIAGGQPNLTGTLLDAGTITQGDAYLDFYGGGEVHVLGGGLFDVANPSAGYQFRNYGGPGVTVESGGVLRHSGASSFFTGGVPVNVTGGLVDVAASVFQMNSGGILTDASFAVSAGATLLLDGTTHTLNGTLSGTGAGTVRFATGTLTAGTNVTLNFPAGLFSWGGDATLAGAVFTNTGTIQIADNEPNLYTRLNNAGTITQGNAYLDFYSGGEVHVLNGGLFDIANTSDGYQFRNYGGPGLTVENGGTFRHSGTGYFLTGGVPINILGGTVEVTGRSLQLNSSGTLTNTSFVVSAGKTLYLDGADLTVNGTLSGTGAGTVRFATGTLTAGTNVTLNFPAGQFSWGNDANLSGGTWTNTGAIQIPDGQPNLNTLLINAGTITEGEAYLDFNGGGEVHVLNGGLFDITNTGAGYQFRNYGGPGLTVESGGVLRHSGSGYFLAGSVPINIHGGTVAITDSYIQFNTSGTLDNAIFSVAAGKTFYLDGTSQTVNGTLTGTGAGTVRFGAGTLTAGVNATLSFSTGIFSWGGDANLSGGTWTNTGTIQIPDGQPNLNTELVNLGTITEGDAYLDFTAGGKLRMLNGGVFDTANTGAGYQFRNYGGPGVFVEDGGIFRHSGTGYFFTGGVPINVTGGTVDVTESYIQLNSGGSLTNAIFTVAAGKTLYLDGTSLAVNGKLSSAGPGTVRFGAGTLSAGADAALNFDPGIFSWGGDANLSGGTWTNLGTIQIDDSQPNLNTLLLNKGVIVNGTAYLDFTSANAELRVQDGGLFHTVNSANGYQFRNYAGVGLVVETGGIFRHSGSGQFFTGGVPFSNLGTVEVESGSLVLSAVAQISGSTLAGGTWDVAAGATLDLSSPTLTTNAGTIRLHGNANFVGLGTTLSQNSGTLEFLDGASRGFTANFTNSGLLRIGASTTVTAGAGFTNTASGEVLFVIGGTPATGAFGKLNISGVATLAGTAGVELANGYGPLTGQQFTLMTFTSRTGFFAEYDQPRIGRVTAFDPVLGDTNLVLTALIDASDLTTTAVTSGASGTAGQNFTVNYTIENTSDAITLASSWTDSVYLSLDGTFDASDKLIGRVTHTGALAGHTSYNGSLTAPLPGAVDGYYHVIVIADSRGNVPDRDRTNNTGASAATFSLSVPALTPDVALNGTIAAGQDLYFRVDLPTGQTPNFHALYALAGEAELYIQRNDVPTLATFDAKDFSLSQTSADITRYDGGFGTFYVLLHGREAAAGGQNFTLTAKGLPFGAAALSLNHGSDLGSVTTIIRGSLFTPSTTFSLVSGGTVQPASSVTFVDGATAWVTFDLHSLGLGSYDVRASDGATQATLPGAFTVNHGESR